MARLYSILESFNPVSLEEIAGVKLMNRIDQKFWFSYSMLEGLLEQLIPVYDILEINGKRLVEYQTIYFDSVNDQMYLHHHNGFRDRYKVRRRKYETSDSGFLEIKKKTNKQRTIKKRVEVPFHSGAITETEGRYLTENSPCRHLNPEPVLFNRFRRISLVNKKKNERCTIDIQLNIKNHYKEISLADLAIIEIKKGNLLETSPLIVVLKQLKINQKGLSKYCTGRALLEPELKSNRFKDRLLHLEKKIINNQLVCINC